MGAAAAMVAKCSSVGLQPTFFGTVREAKSSLNVLPYLYMVKLYVLFILPPFRTFF